MLRERRLDFIQRRKAAVVRLGIVERDVVQRRRVVVVLGSIVKGQTLHIVTRRNFTGDLERFVIRDIGNHDLGRAERHKLALHDIKADLGLGFRRQVVGEVVFNFGPIA